ncbi:TraR/DksA family transcriptional regulator [Streptomyces sp. N2-109]|uniref:TraR/DksA family transcriptional regulator n=1 Tax=Streptomyces gossypii TaxID=2883101 RepID=A0ABT2JZQ7_9ACTN|nr:TraR/DksA family transcriptional regulator [Streptomyces gossypii]MCT2593392.1 TraR/DksA family transcriptional regulator [Streptomyces gossypii]
MVARRTTAKESAESRTAGDEAAAAPARSAAETAPAKKAGEKKAAPRKAAAKKAAPKKAAPKKAEAKKTQVKKAAAEKVAKKAPAARPGVSKKSAAQPAAGKAAAKKTGAQRVAAKKTPAAKAAAVPTARMAQMSAATAGELAVRPGEDPWTPEEVAEARAELESEAARLHAEILASEEALVGLMRDSGDGAGDDDADTGTKNITREHEMSLAANAREMVYQTERALERLEAGTYGLCENCGNPIGKARMQAFPRATLCVECKQKQERR